MTKKEAKILVLEVHQYLYEHPEITDKKYLPKNLYNKIKGLHNICPLCETCFKDGLNCPECPLETCGEGSHYRHWSSMKTKKERKKYAKFIIDKVNKWEPKG